MDINDFIISQSTGNLYWKDTQGRYLGCNLTFSNMLRLASPDEIVGKTDHDLFFNTLGEKQLNAMLELDQFVINSGQEKTVEETGVDKDGKLAIYLTKKVPLIENGKIIGLVGTSINITKEKELENTKIQQLLADTKARTEEETLRAIMLLISSVAHDLRSPLFSIASSGCFIHDALPTLLDTYHLAQKANLPIENPISSRLLPELGKIAESISETVNEINTSINEALKALSHTSIANSTKEDHLLCKLDRCINNTLIHYPFTKHERELIKWQRQHDFSFIGNPILFSRILINIIKDGLLKIHHNQKGQIFISAETEGAMNILRIKDTAGGASPEIVDHIFDSDGLEFCKTVMQNFGGDIICQSDFKEYKEFILSFPKVTNAEGNINPDLLK